MSEVVIYVSLPAPIFEAAVRCLQLHFISTENNLYYCNTVLLHVHFTALVQ